LTIEATLTENRLVDMFSGERNSWLWKYSFGKQC